jgi:hypothetical protein
MEIKYGANNCMRDAAKPMNTILRRAPPLVDMTKAVCGMQMPANLQSIPRHEGWAKDGE